MHGSLSLEDAEAGRAESTPSKSLRLAPVHRAGRHGPPQAPFSLHLSLHAAPRAAPSGSQDCGIHTLARSQCPGAPAPPTSHPRSGSMSTGTASMSRSDRRRRWAEPWAEGPAGPGLDFPPSPTHTSTGAARRPASPSRWALRCVQANPLVPETMFSLF